MGLFFGGYDKPGAGVDKNAPKKRGLFLYIELIARKFGSFLRAGFLFSLFSIPVLALIYVLTVFVLGQPILAIQNTALSIMQSNGVPESEISGQLGTVTFGICSTVAVFFVSMWGSGPLSAGLSYVFRCFTREQPVWVWSDGKDKVRENAKQGFLVLLIDIIVFIFTPTAIIFYYNLGEAAGMKVVSTIFVYILSLAMLIYTMMHPFLYQIMVTFDTKFKDLFKNSMLLVLAHLPLCLLLTLISLVLITVPFGLWGVTGSMALVFIGLTIGYMFLRYPMEFYAARIIERTFLDNKELKKKTIEVEYEDEV